MVTVRPALAIVLLVICRAQVGADGNVNVSRVDSRTAGAGGFINISQNARELYFPGTFTSGRLKIECRDGELKILNEGKT